MANSRLKITELPKIVYYGINTHPNALGIPTGTYAPVTTDKDDSVHKDDELVIACHDVDQSSAVKTSYSISMQEIQRFVLQQSKDDLYSTETLVIGRSSPGTVDGITEGNCNVKIAGNLEIAGGLSVTDTAGSFSTGTLNAVKVNVTGDDSDALNAKNLKVTEKINLSTGILTINGINWAGTSVADHGAAAVGKALVVNTSTTKLKYDYVHSDYIKVEPSDADAWTLTKTVWDIQGRLDTLEGYDHVTDHHTQDTDTKLDTGTVEIVTAEHGTAASYSSYNAPAELGDSSSGAETPKRVVLTDTALVLPKHKDAEDLTDESVSKNIRAVLGEVRWNIFNGVPTLYIATNPLSGAGLNTGAGKDDAKEWHGIPLFGGVGDFPD